MAISKELVLEIQEKVENDGTVFSIAKLRQDEPPNRSFNLNSLFEAFDKPNSTHLPQIATMLHNRLLERGAVYIEAKYDRLFKILETVFASRTLVPMAGDQEELCSLAFSLVELWQTRVRSEIEAAMPMRDALPLNGDDVLKQKAIELKEEATRDTTILAELAHLEATHNTRPDVLAVEQRRARIVRFYKQHFVLLSHPFDENSSLQLSRSELDQAINFIFFIATNDQAEFRLEGVGQKLTSALVRYLDCPRDSPGVVFSAAEHIASVFEPFLKKCALILIPNTLRNGRPVWQGGLDGLIDSLGISSEDLKETNKQIWKSRSIQNATLRIIYRLRNIASHEAHASSALEAEYLCHYSACAYLIAALKIIQSGLVSPTLMQAYTAEDEIRDLFPLIEDLVRRAQDSYNTSRRIDKLGRFANQARQVWPTTSRALTEQLRSELGFLSEILSEKEREDFLESLGEDEPYY